MSSRYNLAEDGLTYKFTTASGDLYIAYFTEFILTTKDGGELCIPMFGFERKSQHLLQESRMHFDEKVKNTLQHLIREFFRLNPDKGVVYICSQDGGKQRARHVTFSRWFNDLGDAYAKYDSPEEYNENTFYSSLILLNANAEKEQYIDAFFHTIEIWMGHEAARKNTG
ncbi:DUF6169 family protein [Filimonas effusa]|uniref:Uncharacterized protein n=1 Tax=Filimonas effusa TaxID=2508721 RepID=A0A4Q1DBY3_9BACT|nr:DUF6169 family protein [Filimonas effusa]RXK86957.1 hypothetical protein ESB13_09280 [Filimonas effusa]